MVTFLVASQVIIFIGSPGRARTADPVINSDVRTLFSESTFCDFTRNLVVWDCIQFSIIRAFCLRTMAREWHKKMLRFMNQD